MPTPRASIIRSGYYVGLMSGTSADGIDAVVVRLEAGKSGLGVSVRSHVHRPFAAPLRRKILHACLHGHVAEICELNFQLGEAFARVAQLAIGKARLSPKQIIAIGSHGQTVHHLPNAKFPSTLQIGEPAVIAERTRITTVADFRVRDMAAGGQGAPLVPYADWVLFADPTRPRIIQNIGGVGNLTFLQPEAKLSDLVAFDTGPGNMVIDAVVTKLSDGKMSFDRHGRWAAEGQVSTSLLAWCLKHPYLKRKLPKTTGREEFGETFASKYFATGKKLRVSAADLVATATAFTAASIAGAYKTHVLPKIKRSDIPKLQIILGGGGAKNPTLVRMLRERIAGGALLTHEDFGMDSSVKEAVAFAILAQAALAGCPNNVSSVTGARRAVVMGKIIPA